MAAFVAIAMAGPARAATPLPAPAPDRVLYDEANVMAPADAEAVDRIAAELAAKTGVTIVVVTVPRLVDETIDELAVRVGHGWGVGRRGEDRGVVIALSIGDRRIHVATGYASSACRTSQYFEAETGAREVPKVEL